MKLRMLLLISILLLPGCDAKDEIDRGMELRTSLLKADSVEMNVDICADYGENACSFAMDCVFDGNGDMTFRVTEPESISGITGKITEEQGTLTFDDTVLYFERLVDDQISPASSPWILMKTLRSGCLTSAGTENEQVRLSIDDSYEEDALHLDIWIGADNLPQYAEIVYGGRRILSLSVRNFVIL